MANLRLSQNMPFLRLTSSNHCKPLVMKIKKNITNTSVPMVEQKQSHGWWWWGMYKNNRHRITVGKKHQYCIAMKIAHRRTLHMNLRIRMRAKNQSEPIGRLLFLSHCCPLSCCCWAIGLHCFSRTPSCSVSPSPSLSRSSCSSRVGGFGWGAIFLNCQK